MKQMMTMSQGILGWNYKCFVTEYFTTCEVALLYFRINLDKLKMYIAKYISTIISSKTYT